jgi:hypothetical protein
MRVKCNDTPGGVNWAISGSTVGLPGGTKNPIRVRHPIMVLFRSWLPFLPLDYSDDLVPPSAKGVVQNSAGLGKHVKQLPELA